MSVYVQYARVGLDEVKRINRSREVQRSRFCWSQIMQIVKSHYYFWSAKRVCHNLICFALTLGRCSVSCLPCSLRRHWHHSGILRICPDTQSRACRCGVVEEVRAGQEGGGPLQNSCSPSLWLQIERWDIFTLSDLTKICLFCVSVRALLYLTSFYGGSVTSD